MNFGRQQREHPFVRYIGALPSQFWFLRERRTSYPDGRLLAECLLEPCSYFSEKLKGRSFLLQGKKKHININKFAGLSRDWVGAKNVFMCFFRAISYGGEKTHKQNSPKIPGQSRGNFVYVFCSLCVFFAPYYLRVSLF